jgi:alpha-tubulin suppressor-like RCC1 family protein
MSLDTTTLQTNLTTRLAALDGTETFEAVLSLTAAIDNLTTNRFMSVATYDDLPNLTTTPLPSGSLIFVEEFNIMMMSVDTQWKGIDERLPPPPAAYAWGSGYRGRLGDGVQENRSSPVTVVGGIIWTQVSAAKGGGATAGRHSLGLASTGIAYAWGDNYNGKLGDNTTTNRSSPVTVVGGITNWSQLSAGYQHSLGVTSTGITYAWGRGYQGQLGINSIGTRSSPVTVVGGITTWSQLSAGDHTLGRTSDGIVYAWGIGANGLLGNNAATNRSSPVTVVGGITTWSQVSASGYLSLGRTSAGIAYAWGSGSFGKLGDNTTVNKSSPVTVVGGITNWSQVAAGGIHGLGLTSSGIAYAWGGNFSGRLGDNTTTSKSSPVTVVGGITNWTQLSGGGYFSLGLASTGIAYAWGASAYVGALGDNTTTNRSSPVTVVGGITNWSQLSAGGSHSLGITA